MLASVAMLVCALLANVLAPHELMAAGSADVDFSTTIPKRFGVWTYVPSIGLVKPADTAENPELQNTARAWKIYSQVMGRGYQDDNGHIVMLMVAYGPAQDAALKAHRPEVCYSAAGFRVTDKSEAAVTYRDGMPPLVVTRLTTERESRLEPVSYWMRIGSLISHGVIDRQLIRLKYGLKGVIPDGALIRISTTDLPPGESFRLQDKFIRDLFAAMAPKDLPFFIGGTI